MSNEIDYIPIPEGDDKSPEGVIRVITFIVGGLFVLVCVVPACALTALSIIGVVGSL
ncbi:MAG: hypothetical protein ACLFTK_08080 [Anaerolineales bacterium]